MEKNLNETLNGIYEILQKLMSLHSELLASIEAERESLIQADLMGIQNTASQKQALIENIHNLEVARLKLVGKLAILWKIPIRELTLPHMITRVSKIDSKSAEQFQNIYHALSLLIKKVTDQNQDNQLLIERSLAHIHEMKKNILSEAAPKSSTYSQQAQKVSSSPSSRLISKEA